MEKSKVFISKKSKAIAKIAFSYNNGEEPKYWVRGWLMSGIDIDGEQKVLEAALNDNHMKYEEGCEPEGLKEKLEEIEGKIKKDLKNIAKAFKTTKGLSDLVKDGWSDDAKAEIID